MKIPKFIHWPVALACVAMTVGYATGYEKPHKAIPTKGTAIDVGTTSYRWANVSIGGGGFVTGVFLDDIQQDLAYIRTDIGGAYRWNTADTSWTPLSDSFGIDQSTYYGIEALATAPNNGNIIYKAAGKYSTWGPKGTILKSVDQGKTWTKLNIDLPMGGNEDYRWAGERLAISPSDPSLIFFGSRRDGLWKSADAGATWAKVDSFPQTLTDGIGVLSIVFDKQTAGVVYANAYGDGIYESSDAGVTWTKLAGSPSEVQRMVATSNGILYATHMSGVSKYVEGVWSDITPNGTPAFFNALGVNPTNANDLIVAYGQSTSTKIYRSIDGGINWTQKLASLDITVPWWKDYMFSTWTSTIEFDPKVPGKVWMTDGSGTWQTSNINANPVVWTSYAKGLENIVAFALAAPPQGSLLLSGIADFDGFKHNNGLDAFPSTTLGTLGLYSCDTFGITIAESNPLQIVRVGGARWNSTYSGATSLDGGTTWNKWINWTANKMPLRVAVSATNPNLFVVVVSEDQALRTTDGGVTWSPVEGLPKGPTGPWYWGQPLAADKVDGNTFYYYSAGKVYRSDNGGASFSVINASLPSNEWYAIKTVQGVENEVWISLNESGLFRSVDGGITFTKITSAEQAHLFAFGRARKGSNTATLYMYGKVSGAGQGIFRSLTKGKTWTKISVPQTPIGAEPNVMEASRQRYGLVFIGTNGNGIYYGTPSTTTPTAALPPVTNPR